MSWKQFVFGMACLLALSPAQAHAQASLAGTAEAPRCYDLARVFDPDVPADLAAAEIAVMRGVRQVLDPAGIMNPGKLFDP